MIKNPGKANSDALLKAEFKAYKRLKERMQEKDCKRPNDPEYIKRYNEWLPLYLACDIRGLTLLNDH